MSARSCVPPLGPRAFLLRLRLRLGLGLRRLLFRVRICSNDERMGPVSGCVRFCGTSCSSVQPAASDHELCPVIEPIAKLYNGGLARACTPASRKPAYSQQLATMSSVRSSSSLRRCTMVVSPGHVHQQAASQRSKPQALDSCVRSSRPWGGVVQWQSHPDSCRDFTGASLSVL